MVRLSDIFDIRYGNQFDFSKMTLSDHTDAVNFISRGSTDCGLVGRVRPHDYVEPFPAGLITVTLGGSYLLASFVQQQPFYTGQNVKVLTPKGKMSLAEKLYYCTAIQHNRFRYHSHSREANSTFDMITVPGRDEIPAWVRDGSVRLVPAKSEGESPGCLNVADWLPFRYGDLFDIRKGKRLTKEDMVEGVYPFIGATDANNGITAYVANDEFLHEGNKITVSYNGSIAEAFYQPVPFVASDDVNVLYPQFSLNKYIAIFLCTLIRREKYRFNYGRKWHAEKMRESVIRLPARNGTPDWDYMERFIKGLSYSAKLREE